MFQPLFVRFGEHYPVLTAASCGQLSRWVSEEGGDRDICSLSVTRFFQLTKRYSKTVDSVCFKQLDAQDRQLNFWNQIPIFWLLGVVAGG